MKRIVFTAPGVAALEEFTLPPLADDQILVRTLYSVLSAGTERANLLAMPNAGQRFPQYPGYCAVARVEQCGGKTGAVAVGDRVIVYHGGHATHSIVSTGSLESSDANLVQAMQAIRPVKVPDGVESLDAAFTVIASMGLQGVRKLHPELGESGAVIGMGLLGLFALQCMRLSGVHPVIAIDMDKDRLALAKELGADYVFTPGEPGLIEKIKSLTGGQGLRMIAEISGAASALVLALDLVAPQGRISLTGCTRVSDCPIDFYQKVHRPGVTLIGAHNYVRPLYESMPGYWTRADDYRTLLALLEAKKLQVGNICSEVISPRQAPEIYRRLAENPVAPLGVVFDWQDVDAGN